MNLSHKLSRKSNRKNAKFLSSPFGLLFLEKSMEKSTLMGALVGDLENYSFKCMASLTLRQVSLPIWFAKAVPFSMISLTSS